MASGNPKNSGTRFPKDGRSVFRSAVLNRFYTLSVAAALVKNESGKHQLSAKEIGLEIERLRATKLETYGTTANPDAHPALSTASVERHLAALDRDGWIRWTARTGSTPSSIEIDLDETIGGLRVSDWIHILRQPAVLSEIILRVGRDHFAASNTAKESLSDQSAEQSATPEETGVAPSETDIS